MSRLHALRNVALACSALLWIAPVTGLAAAKDDVVAAAQKLADSSSYSWTASQTGGNASGNTEGKTEKDGVTWLKIPTRDSEVTAIMQGDKTVVKSDADWQDLSELQDAQGPMRYMGAMLKNYKKPADQAKELAEEAPELKKEGDAFSADLPQATATKLLSMRRGRNSNNGDNAPKVTNGVAQVKFWVGDDGVLKKMELHVAGSVSYNGNDRDVDRTTTTEFKDVNSTKVEIPEDAKAKLAAATASPTTQPKN